MRNVKGTTDGSVSGFDVPFESMSSWSCPEDLCAAGCLMRPESELFNVAGGGELPPLL